jgi:hypothetical protein
MKPYPIGSKFQLLMNGQGQRMMGLAEVLLSVSLTATAIETV